MPEGERAQKRPKCRGRPDPSEQPLHRTVPQHSHVVDRVGAGDHPRDQRPDLQVRVDPGWLAQLHVLSDQALQTGAFGQLQHGREPGARHQVRVIEDGREAVAHSHLADALPLWSN